MCELICEMEIAGRIKVRLPLFFHPAPISTNGYDYLIYLI